jgi:hypothetical protein
MSPFKELCLRLEAAQRAQEQRLIDAKAARNAEYQADLARGAQPLRGTTMPGSRTTGGVFVTHGSQRGALTR